MEAHLFVSLCVIAIATVDNFAGADPSKEAKLIITPENVQPITVHLKQAKTYLANEHLPMWIIKDKQLQRLDTKKVMQDLGHFTTYRDVDTSSAAVYFHKQQEFDGTIDIRYVMREYHISDGDNDSNNIEQQYVNHEKNKQSVFERLRWGHSTETSVANIEWKFPSVVAEWRGKKLSNVDTMADKSCGHNRERFYIESLVIINYDLAKELAIEYHQGLASIVSYLLTLFNSVDMLFSKIRSPKLKINIAGIIIINERGSFPHITRCYQEKEKFNRTMDSIDVVCVDQCINSYLFDKQKQIPFDSYDITVFLTRHPLYEYEYNRETGKAEGDRVAGYTKFPSKGIYESKKRDRQFHAGIFVEDFAYFGSVAVIAHEMVHAFGVIEHDEQNNINDGMCYEKLMKPRNGFCQSCLDWSDSTKAQLDHVFRSPDSCTFRNKPRSLYSPEPQSMLTADEQCRCYHYETAQSSPQSLWSIISTCFWSYCEAYLQCKGKDGQIYSAPVPMDGTPCEENTTPNKVCWNRSCTEIKNMNLI